MSDTKIFLELSSEIQQTLSENSISIADILVQNNIDAGIEYGLMPVLSQEGSRTKDLVPIILASSGAVLAISLAISQILNAIYDKPHFVEYWAEEEFRDKNGNILTDKKTSKPQTKLVKKFEIIEPAKRNKETMLEIGAGNIVIKFSVKEGGTDKSIEK